MKFTNEQFRFWIWMQSQRGESLTDIHKTMVDIVGDRAYSFRRVCAVITQFNSGRTSFKDACISGRPVTVANEETIARVRKLIADNKRITIRMLSYECSISYKTIWRIIHNVFNMNKICSRWHRAHAFASRQCKSSQSKAHT